MPWRPVLNKIHFFNRFFETPGMNVYYWLPFDHNSLNCTQVRKTSCNWRIQRLPVVDCLEPTTRTAKTSFIIKYTTSLPYRIFARSSWRWDFRVFSDVGNDRRLQQRLRRASEGPQVVPPHWRWRVESSEVAVPCIWRLSRCFRRDRSNLPWEGLWRRVGAQGGRRSGRWSRLKESGYKKARKIAMGGISSSFLYFAMLLFMPSAPSVWSQAYYSQTHQM